MLLLLLLLFFFWGGGGVYYHIFFPPAIHTHAIKALLNVVLAVFIFVNTYIYIKYIKERSVLHVFRLIWS